MDGLPLELACTWPLAEREVRLALAHGGRAVAIGRSGRWSCELADGALAWDAAVFDLFGLNDARAALNRADALACYEEGSRAAMERLRAHAIRHRRGFTVDVRIRPADGAASRWIRLSAAAAGGIGRAPTRIEGIKTDVTTLYR